jgi:hypothetical protein
MKAEYLSQLENILELRHENDDVRKQFKLSNKSIENINQVLLSDHILIDNFTGIAEERTVTIRSIENYGHSSLDDVNSEFTDQSNIIKSIWDDYSMVKTYLTKQELFNGLAEKAKENEDNYQASRNIGEVKKHHKQVSELHNEKKSLDKVVKDVQELTKILESLPIFKWLLVALQERQNDIIRAKTVETIYSHYIWFADLIKSKNELKYIDREIKSFKKFIKKNTFYKQKKWIELLEKECVSAKYSGKIKQLHIKTKARKQLFGTIDKLSKDWGKMFEYCTVVYSRPIATKHCNKDKEDIIKKLSLLESKSVLDDNKVKKIQKQLNKKLKHIKEIVDKPYSSIEYKSYTDFWDVLLNVIYFFVNILIWPFALMSRRSDKSLSIEKSVLEW